MNSRNRIRLLSHMKSRLPAIVEENKNNLMWQTRSYIQKDINFVNKVSFIFHEWPNMKKNSQNWKTNLVCPLKFLSDFIRVKMCPHLDLVDSIGRSVVKPSWPFIFVIPRLSFINWPPSRVYIHAHRNQKKEQGKIFFHEEVIINLLIELLWYFIFRKEI